MRNTQTSLDNLHLPSNLRKLFSHLIGGMVNRVLLLQYESFNDLGGEMSMVDGHWPAGLGPGHLGHHVLQLVLSSVLDHQRKTAAEAIRLLDTSLNLHIQQTKTAVTNLDFYIKLNADFLMELAQEYLVHCGAKPKLTSAGPPKHLVKAIKLLENVTK